MEYLDYKKFLKEELASRVERNPRYSLRSFADSLGVAPSHLSRVISGQKRLSLSCAARVTQKLNFNSKESNYFIDLVQLEHVKDHEVKGKILERLCKHSRLNHEKILDIEMFKIISNWYHFAILSLSKLKIQKSSSVWVAKKLGLNEQTAQMAINRLKDLKLLSEDSGRLVTCQEAEISTTDDVASVAIQKNHEENIEKAKKALYAQTLDLREFGNCTLSIQMRDLPKAKVMIREAIKKLNFELDTQNGDELFQLNVQFFKLTEE